MNLLSGIEQIKQLPVDRQRRFERFSRTQYRYRVLPLFADVYLIIAFIGTLLFLAGQLAAWKQLTAMVLGDFSNPSVGFFFMISGIHGLHMMGGLVALIRAISRAFGQSDVRAMEHSVSNCALYWHYLLGVWLVVFGLLFTGNNFEILLRICGFI